MSEASSAQCEVSAGCRCEHARERKREQRATKERRSVLFLFLFFVFFLPSWGWLTATTATAGEADDSSGRLDDVDALTGVFPAYVLAHVAPLLAAGAAVRALELGRQAALVAQVSPEAFDHGVTVAALGAHVALTTVPATSTGRCPPDTLARVELH